jgi:hypothetical protein
VRLYEDPATLVELVDPVIETMSILTAVKGGQIASPA